MSPQKRKINRFFKGESVIYNTQKAIVKFDLKTEGIILYSNNDLTDWHIVSRHELTAIKPRTGKESKLNREKRKFLSSKDLY